MVLIGDNMKNIFYFRNINSVGGCESHWWYLSKEYEFTAYYRTADAEQIKRLARNIEVHKYKEPIKCDRFFCNYAYDIEVEAPIKKHIIHCDYKQVSFPPIQYEGFEYIGVSKLACNSFKELTGKEAELIYNPISIEPPKVKKYNDGKLHLISATRLTKEKGLKRMQKLARLLYKAGIDYEWVVYTNRKREAIGENVIYKDPKLDILEDIAKADYLVQLSDCEAYCYTIIEALMCNTPVIVTDLPVFKELGIKHGKNAIVCDLSMNNVDLDMIKEKSLKFDYKPPKSNWGKYLSRKKTYNPNEIVEAKVIKGYTDTELNKKLTRGDTIKIPKHRASYLEARELVEWQ